MRYIKLFEAFRSDILSAILPFLKKTEGFSKFKEELENLSFSYDFLMDKIDKEDISYLRTKKGAVLRPSSDYVYHDLNVFDIKYIKFWFKKDRYLGHTTTGKTEIEGSGLDYKDLLSIKEMGFKKGKVIRPSQYRVEHGDIVFFKHNGILEKGEMFFKNRYDNFLLQNVIGEDIPDDSEMFDSGYSKYFERLDYIRMYKLVENDDDIHIVDMIEEIDLPGFNINDDRRGNEAFFEISDFCVIFDYDNYLKKDNIHLYQIKNKRKEEKKGASFLISDEDIRKKNIDKRDIEILKKMGLMGSDVELNNLQKILIDFFGDDFGYRLVTENIDSSLNDIDEETISSDSFIKYYRWLKKNDVYYKHEELSDLNKLLDEISKIVYDYITRERNINNISVLQEYLSNITEIVRKYRRMYRMPYDIRYYFLKENIEDVEDTMDSYLVYSTEVLEEFLEKMKKQIKDF